MGQVRLLRAPSHVLPSPNGRARYYGCRLCGFESYWECHFIGSADGLLHLILSQMPDGQIPIMEL